MTTLAYSSVRADVAALATADGWKHPAGPTKSIGIKDNKFDSNGYGVYKRSCIDSAHTTFLIQHKTSVVMADPGNGDRVGPICNMGDDGSCYAAVTDGDAGDGGSNTIYRIDASGVRTSLSNNNTGFTEAVLTGHMITLERLVDNGDGDAVLECKTFEPDGTEVQSFTLTDPNPLNGIQPGIMIHSANAGGATLTGFEAEDAASGTPTPGLRIENRIAAGGSFIPNATHTYLVIIGSTAYEVSKAVVSGLCEITSDDLPNGVDLAIDQQVFVSVPDGNPNGDDPANMLTVVDINDPATRS